MDILIFLVIFSALVGWWANNLGRNGWLWFVIAVLVSPLITAVILLFMGSNAKVKAKKEADNIEAEAQKQAAIEKRKAELLSK